MRGRWRQLRVRIEIFEDGLDDNGVWRFVRGRKYGFINANINSKSPSDCCIITRSYSFTPSRIFLPTVQSFSPAQQYSPLVFLPLPKFLESEL